MPTRGVTYDVACRVPAPLRALASLIARRVRPADVPVHLRLPLTDLALRRRLAPMLWWTLKQTGGDPVDWPGGAALAASAHRAAAIYALMAESQCRITAALDAARIPAVWIKGAALAPTVYPEPSLRPMLDLDLLVPIQQRHPALKAIENLGYAYCHNGYFRNKNVDTRFLQRIASHHDNLVGGRASPVMIELHFRLLSHGNDVLLPVDRLAWFRDQTEPFALDGCASCMGLAPEAHLLYLAAHNVLQHRETHLLGDLDLYWLLDRRTIDWPKAIRQAVCLGWTAPVARALERAVALFGCAVPETVFVELRDRRPAHEDPRLIQNRRPPGAACETAWRILSQLTWLEKLRYLGHSLTPCARYMRWRYDVPPARPIWPLYLYRWFDQGRQLAQAVARATTQRQSIHDADAHSEAPRLTRSVLECGSPLPLSKSCHHRAPNTERTFSTD